MSIAISHIRCGLRAGEDHWKAEMRPEGEGHGGRRIGHGVRAVCDYKTIDAFFAAAVNIACDSDPLVRENVDAVARLKKVNKLYFGNRVQKSEVASKPFSIPRSHNSVAPLPHPDSATGVDHANPFICALGSASVLLHT